MRFPNITWQPCVAHVIDLFLEDVAKLEWARGAVAAGRNIIKFIKHHHFTLALVPGQGTAGGAAARCALDGVHVTYRLHIGCCSRAQPSLIIIG